MERIVYTDSHQRQVRRVLPDLFRHRHLLWNLIAKDFRIRYRYAVIGFAWAVLEPLLMCLVLTFLFSYVFEIRDLDPTITSRWEFAGLLLCALVPWQFTSDVLGRSSSALIDHQGLVTKVNFPREVVPLSIVGIGLVNLVIGLVIVFILVSFFVGIPGPTILAVPFIVVIQCAFVEGAALLLATANLRFRDVQHVVRVALMFGFYATPIFYTSGTISRVFSELPEPYQWLHYVYNANPMVGLVTAYRDAILLHEWPAIDTLAWPTVCALVTLAMGMAVFRRASGTMADYL